MGNEAADSIRILVVDDEPISADELSELLADELRGYGNVAVRTAYNASTAIKMVTEAPCDILISDIQMPGKTGLELAKEVRALVPDVCILFLTGFDDFAYAYEAFRQNAVHYLLKTEGDEAILRAVRETVDKLLLNRSVARRISEAEQRYTQMIPAYRKGVFSTLLQGVPWEQDAEEIRELFPGACYLVLGRMDMAATGAMRMKLVAQSSVQQIVEDAVGESLQWSETTQMETELVWAFAMRQEEPRADVLFQLIRKARKQLEEQCGARLFFLVADTPVTVEELAEKYGEMHNALMRDVARGEAGTAIRRSMKAVNLTDEAAQRQYAMLHRQLDLCENDLRNNALELLEKHVQPLLEALRQSDALDAYGWEYDARLIAMLLGYVNRNALFHLLESAGVLVYKTPAENADAIQRLIALLQEDAEKHINVAIKSIAHVVIDFIHEHISQDIGISDLAEATGYSAGYLSRVFRQEEGVSIHEYMTMMRIDLARELLINTNLRVYEIAASCGYDNATYFIKVFKNNTGFTPQEFKQNSQHRGR